MKKMMIALVAMLTIAATGKAMSYEQARNEALFLTDKMAYELNLTDAQYEAAFEINLDYLMGVTSYDDVFGTYWERRNLDLSYILLDWQWNAFCAASYFYRPLYWRNGFWHFGIYLRYPHRDHFFYGRPAFYATYRGGHAWHRVGGHGYYHGRSDHFRHAAEHGRSHVGMHNRLNSTSPSHHRPSSVTPSHSNHSSRPEMNSNHSSHSSRPEMNSNQTNHSSHSATSGSGSLGRSHSSGSFGRSSSGASGSHSSSGSLGRSHSSGSFGRSSSGATSSHSSGSFSRSGGGVSRSSGSFSSAGRSSGGGHSYGGRR